MSFIYTRWESDKNKYDVFFINPDGSGFVPIGYVEKNSYWESNNRLNGIVVTQSHFSTRKEAANWLLKQHSLIMGYP